jgi:hypothetical protein
MANPDRAIAGCAGERIVATCDGGARRACKAFGPMGVEKPDRTAEQRVAHAWHTIGAADFLQHGIRAVLLPVDQAVALPAQRSKTVLLHRVPTHRTMVSRFDAGERHCHRLDGRIGDLAAIEARFGRGAHREVHRSPDRTRIHLRLGLEDGHPPDGCRRGSTPQRLPQHSSSLLFCLAP